MNSQNCLHIGEMFYRFFRVFTIVMGIICLFLAVRFHYHLSSAPSVPGVESEDKLLLILAGLALLGLMGMWLTHSLDPKPPPVHKN